MELTMMCVCVCVWYLFCTIIMAIQSDGYTCFPIRSLNSRNVSMRKSCKPPECVSVCLLCLLYAWCMWLCVYVCVCVVCQDLLLSRMIQRRFQCSASSDCLPSGWGLLSYRPPPWTGTHTHTQTHLCDGRHTTTCLYTHTHTVRRSRT